MSRTYMRHNKQRKFLRLFGRLLLLVLVLGLVFFYQYAKPRIAYRIKRAKIRIEDYSRYHGALIQHWGDCSFELLSWHSFGCKDFSGDVRLKPRANRLLSQDYHFNVKSLALVVNSWDLKEWRVNIRDLKLEPVKNTLKLAREWKRHQLLVQDDIEASTLTLNEVSLEVRFHSFESFRYVTYATDNLLLLLLGEHVGDEVDFSGDYKLSLNGKEYILSFKVYEDEAGYALRFDREGVILAAESVALNNNAELIDLFISKPLTTPIALLLRQLAIKISQERNSSLMGINEKQLQSAVWGDLLKGLIGSEAANKILIFDKNYVPLNELLQSMGSIDVLS